MEKLYIKFSHRVPYAEIIKHFRDYTISHDIGAMELEWDQKFFKYKKSPRSVKAADFRKALMNDPRNADLELVSDPSSGLGNTRYILAYNYGKKQLEIDEPAPNDTKGTNDTNDANATNEANDAEVSLVERIKSLEDKVDDLYALNFYHYSGIYMAMKGISEMLRFPETEGEQK